MQNPLITVIIATYNRRSLLERAVKSIFLQTCQDFEILIVNDASSDDTPAYLDSLCAQDNRVHAIHLSSNQGPGAARNIAIRAARGEYIAILDDDDRSLPQRLAIQMDYLNKHPEVGGVFSSLILESDIFSDKKIYPDFIEQGSFPEDPQEAFILLYRDGNFIPNTTLMFRRKIIQEFLYPEFIYVGEDRLLCLQLLASGIILHGIKEPLVFCNRYLNHTSLINSDRQRAIQAKRQVLESIRATLAENHDTRFDHLHARAFSNQLVREASAISGIRGLLITIRALILSPGNPTAKKMLYIMISRAFNKFKIY